MAWGVVVTCAVCVWVGVGVPVLEGVRVAEELRVSDAVRLEVLVLSAECEEVCVPLRRGERGTALRKML